MTGHVERGRRPARTLAGETWPEKVMLERHAEAIKELEAQVRKRTALATIRIGEHLHAARSLLSRNGNGRFGKWCRRRLGISRTTANNWLNAYLVFGDCKKFVRTFDVSALYLLSKNGTPKQAIDEALAVGKVRWTPKTGRADKV